MPFIWSICSWVTKTAVKSCGFSPIDESASPILLALTPASTRNLAFPPDIKIEFPLLPEKAGTPLP